MRRLGIVIACAAVCGACMHGGGASAGATRATGEGQVGVARPSDLGPEQIRIVQRALLSHGYTVDIDGRYDAATAAALKRFQADNNLAATGNISFKTAEALG